jgi:carboxymethylenebutenolidase
MKNVLSGKCATWLLVALLFWVRAGLAQTPAPASAEPTVSLPPADTLEYPSGALKLRGLLWRPPGKGSSPAIVLNHGSELTGVNLFKTVPVLLAHGYAVFAPFRRGQYLSQGRGRYIGTVLDSAKKASSPDDYARLVIRLHETQQLPDQLAGIAALKRQADIDVAHIGVMGVSFGGIQAVLAATESVGLRAAVNFASAAMVWEESPLIAQWLKQRVVQARVPIYFAQAANDFSTQPTLALSAEMKRLGKPYQAKIYPAVGTTAMEGHRLVTHPDLWTADVFAFLDAYLRVPAGKARSRP